MSLENFVSLPNNSLHNTLLRRDEGESGHSSDCVGKSDGSPTSIKLCELMDKAVQENENEIFNCVRKRKDQVCKKSCVYTVLSIKMDVIAKFPLIGATAECSDGKGPISTCKASCDQSDSNCKSKCSEDHKYDNISCFSEVLEISEDQVKEMTECPKNKCMDSTTISGLFDCFGKWQELPQDSAEENEDSEDDEELDNQKDVGSDNKTPKTKMDSSSSSFTKSNHSSKSSSFSRSSSASASQSAEESASFRVTTTKLVTLSLFFLSVSINLQ